MRNTGWVVREWLYADTKDGKPVAGAVIAANTTRGLKRGTVEKVKDSGLVVVTLGGFTNLMYSVHDFRKMPVAMRDGGGK